MTRERVRELSERGLSAVQIAARLGIARSTVSYHLRHLGHAPDARFARRYDWAPIAAYYAAGHSVRACQARFGFSKAAWNDAVRRGDVIPRPLAMPLTELLVADTPRGRWNLKRRLVAAGLKEDRCERCGLSEWRGGALSMALHHLNGERHDNRLENLEFLCPNCHSQTENFAGRNRAGPASGGHGSPC